MSWTEPKIQALKDMWGHGYSASEIAKHMGDMSRNAVIGKAHRLKLSALPASTKEGETVSKRLPPMSANGMPAMKSAQKRVMLRPLPAVPTPSIMPTPNRDVFRSTDAIKRTEGIAVTKAGERHCRWPVGDPRSPDFRFCGCTAHEGMPYCMDHARVAYQGGGKKTRSSERSESSTASSEFRMPGHHARF